VAGAMARAKASAQKICLLSVQPALAVGPSSASRGRAPAPVAPARPRRSANDRQSGADPGAAALALLLIWPYHNLSFGPKAQQRNPG